MSEIIRLENVIKMFEGYRRAINDVSVTIQERERVAILGTSGSGKTTLARLIAGMEHPSGGKVVVLGKAIHEMDTDTASEFRNKNIGVMQRNPCFMGTLTITENVALPLAIRGVSQSKSKQAAKEQLKTLGLSYIAHAFSDQLSVYELQLASLAQALVAQPKILLLDDFAANLNVKDTEQIAGILHAVWRFGNYTVVCLSGAKCSVMRADRYLTLDHGEIQEEEQ